MAVKSAENWFTKSSKDSPKDYPIKIHTQNKKYLCFNKKYYFVSEMITYVLEESIKTTLIYLNLH